MEQKGKCSLKIILSQIILPCNGHDPNKLAWVYAVDLYKWNVFIQF